MEKMEQEPQGSEVIIYSTPTGQVKVEILFGDETFWLSQKRMAALFGVDVRTISEHLSNIFKSKELNESSTIRNFRIVQQEGNRQVAREVTMYNLDAIIAVGYRVNSYSATQFRIWATQTLKEFIIKGFVLDDTRLKQGENFGKDYFQELLERIREIRSSERRFYQKITDIYATSADYNAKAPITIEFFQTVQNKLEWAITGKTAAEIIKDRAKANAPNMGLQTWKNGPDGKILKSDVTVAKNYLQENEIRQLNRLVSQYLDYAEGQAERGIVMKMADWVKKLDAFLQFNEYEILKDSGRVSAAVAKQLAEAEYEKFRPIQDKTFQSDFDKVLKNKIQPKE